jgi:hypothetical protein
VRRAEARPHLTASAPSVTLLLECEAPFGTPCRSLRAKGGPMRKRASGLAAGRPAGMVTLKIPRPLYERLQQLVEGTGFRSVTEFSVYVLRDLAAQPRDLPAGPSGTLSDPIGVQKGRRMAVPLCHLPPHCCRRLPLLVRPRRPCPCPRQVVEQGLAYG